MREVIGNGPTAGDKAAIEAFSPRSSPCVRTGRWLSSDCGILRFN